jgi:hypothetical protein
MISARCQPQPSGRRRALRFNFLKAIFQNTASLLLFPLFPSGTYYFKRLTVAI